MNQPGAVQPELLWPRQSFKYPRYGIRPSAHYLSALAYSAAPHFPDLPTPCHQHVIPILIQRELKSNNSFHSRYSRRRISRAWSHADRMTLPIPILVPVPLRLLCPSLSSLLRSICITVTVSQAVISLLGLCRLSRFRGEGIGRPHKKAKAAPQK